MKIQVSGVTAVFSVALVSTLCSAQEKLSPFASVLTNNQKTKKSDFPLATSKAAAPIYLDANDFPVVRLAVDALAGDISSITGA
ncbi:MAG: hypothetical protein EOO38_22460, partial [Cytophagaceae bacterium]